MSLRTSKLIMTAIATQLLSAWACSAATALDGTWRLVSVGGREVSSDAAQVPYFTIRGAEIAGYDGCNQFSGRLDRPASIVTTRRACAGDVIELPIDLGKLERELEAAARKGNRLTLPARGQFPLSVFVRER